MRDRLGETVRMISWEPQIVFSPHDERRNVDVAVERLDLVGEALVCLSDLSVERRLTSTQPELDKCVEYLGTKTGSARVTDVFTDQDLVDVGRQRREDPSVVANQAKERQPPKAQRHHVDEGKGCHVDAVEQMSPEGDRTRPHRCRSIQVVGA